MCGNSVYQDRIFLKQHMPTLHNFFHYRNLDVSSLKILAQIWQPNLVAQKHNQHTALADILESIAELKKYRKEMLKI
jgi:oligoribonuclease